MSTHTDKEQLTEALNAIGVAINTFREVLILGFSRIGSDAMVNGGDSVRQEEAVAMSDYTIDESEKIYNLIDQLPTQYFGSDESEWEDAVLQLAAIVTAKRQRAELSITGSNLIVNRVGNADGVISLRVASHDLRHR